MTVYSYKFEVILPILGRTLSVMICISYYVEADNYYENCTTTVLSA